MSENRGDETDGLMPVESPAWDTVFLVCKKCRKRKGAPGELKGKLLSSAIRHQLPKQKPRPRVVSTSCLGLCPKGAVAVACVGGGKAPRVASVASRDELERAMPSLYPM